MESESKWDSKSVTYFMLLIGCGILGVVSVLAGMAGTALSFGVTAGMCGGILMTREVPSSEEDAEEHF